MTQEALKLALSALDEVRQETFRLLRDGQKLYAEDKVWSTIISIKEVLAKEKALQALHDENERLGLYKDAYAENKPVAWISTGPARMIHWTSDKPAYGDDWIPLYTAPPQRTWVGLTKEEIAEFDTWHDNREEEVGWCNPSEIVAYIEAKLKEKTLDKPDL